MKLTDSTQTVKLDFKTALATTLAAGLLLVPTAHATNFPTKTVHIIVPAAAGGGLDTVARSFTDKLAERWGQSVIVENRPGANFVIGTEAVTKSAPDGHTLLVVSSSAVSINPLAYPDLPYDPLKDLTPVMLLAASPFVLLVNQKLPVKSTKELIKHLHENPKKLNHASNSTSTILASELLKALAEVDYVDINYKGGILAAGSTAAGHTDFAFVDPGSAIASIQSGRTRAIAVTTTERSRLNPDIPTLAESGVPGYEVNATIVLLAPAKTPADVIKKINADLTQVLHLPEVTKRIENINNEVVASTPDEANRRLTAESQGWKKLVQERNIKFR